MFFLFELIGELADLATSPTKNPNLFQHAELDHHTEEIQRLCGASGAVFAVKGQPHTFEGNGIRFKIESGTVRKL